LWKNHGKIWHIDHVIPCAYFDLSKDNEQKKCYHFKNLMPRYSTTKIARFYGSNQMGNLNKGKKNIGGETYW
jgi:hypothetical protein